MFLAGHGVGPDRLQHRADVDPGRLRTETAAESSQTSEKEPQNDDNHGAVRHCVNTHHHSDRGQILAFSVRVCCGFS